MNVFGFTPEMNLRNPSHASDEGLTSGPQYKTGYQCLTKRLMYRRLYWLRCGTCGIHLCNLCITSIQSTYVSKDGLHSFHFQIPWQFADISQVCDMVMFSQAFVRSQGEGGLYVTITRDALDLTVPPSRYGTWGTLPHPPGMRPGGRSAQVGGAHPSGMLSCSLTIS